MGTLAPCGKLKVTSCPMCTPEAVASVESTIAVFVDAIADAVPDTMLSVSTLPRLAGSMAEMPCELPLMSTDVPRTSVTSRRLGSLLQRLRRLRVEVRALREHDEVRAKRAFDRVVGGHANRVGEHRDARDQREPDHQRRGGERGAARIAPRILAGEYSGSAARVRAPATRARSRPARPAPGRAAQHPGRRRGNRRR